MLCSAGQCCLTVWPCQFWSPKDSFFLAYLSYLPLVNTVLASLSLKITNAKIPLFIKMFIQNEKLVSLMQLAIIIFYYWSNFVTSPNFLSTNPHRLDFPIIAIGSTFRHTNSHVHPTSEWTNPFLPIPNAEFSSLVITPVIPIPFQSAPTNFFPNPRTCFNEPFGPFPKLDHLLSKEHRPIKHQIHLLARGRHISLPANTPLHTYCSCLLQEIKVTSF